MEQMDFTTFEQDWLRRHRSSIPRRSVVSSAGLFAGLILWSIIAIGAALVSGAHSVPAILETIPDVVRTPVREVLALFGFTILELLVFAGALYRRDSRYAGYGLVVAMVGALAANIGSSISAAKGTEEEVTSLVVAVILALIAPLAAFLAGEMIHRLYDKHRETRTTTDALYDARRRELDAIINREYAKYVREQQSKVSTVHVSNVSNGQSIGQPTLPAASTIGHAKVQDASKIVYDYLAQHPDAMTLSPRALAGLLGVGKSTVNNVQRDFRERVQSNGHHHGQED